MDREDEGLDRVPLAIVGSTAHDRGRRLGLQALALVTLLLAGVCLVVWFGPRVGERIVIHFADGHGLKAGDSVRLRGIDVGIVESVELGPRLDEVQVQCRLNHAAREVAREGSRFWIVRPSLSWTAVQGLETLIGGRYLAVAPGPERAPPRREFVGMADVPSPSDLIEGGLEITLETDDRPRIVRGSPVRFRGMTVGEVLGLTMASDARTIEIQVWIDPRFRNLVRRNSVFWNDSGVDLQIGYGGVAFDVGTLETVVIGGVAFATPTEIGPQVHTGHRFALQADAPRDWRAWKPSLLVENESLPEITKLPVLLRAEFRTTRKLFGIPREVRRAAWILPLDDGRILVPASFLEPDLRASSLPAFLSFAGREYPWDVQQVVSVGNMLQYWVALDQAQVTPWPVDKLRAPVEPEDCLMVTRAGIPPLPISRNRFTPDGDRWGIDPSLPINSSVNGAAVVSRKDGAVLGLVDVQPDAAFVAIWQAEP